MSVNIIPELRLLAVLAAASMLGACASPHGGHHGGHRGGHHPGPPVNATVPAADGTASAQGKPACGMAGGGMPAGCGGMQHMDKDAMCALQQDLRAAPDEPARQAIMERRMQGMSPEMRQRYVEMMRQHCR